MSSAIRFSFLCAIVVICSCEDSSPTCTSDIHGDDDRCQFLQGGVGVLNRHGGDNHAHEAAHGDGKTHADAKEVIKGDTHAHEAHRDDVKKHAGAKEDAEGIPDFIHAITGILKGAQSSEKAFEDLEKEVLKFKDEVTASTKDVIVHVKASMSLEQAMTQVDTAYNKIWIAAKKVLDAIRKAHHDFTSGMPWIPKRFRSFFNATLASIETKGDDFANSFHVQLGKNITANGTLGQPTAACAFVEKHLQMIKVKASNFATSAIGLSTDGIKKEAKELYKYLPAQAKKEVDKLLAKANDAAQHIMGNMAQIAQEIIDGVAQALHGQCGNLLKLKSSSMHAKVGFVTVCVMSAVSLLL